MEEYKEIGLSQGRVAVVDGSRYDELMQWKWFCNGASNNCYARAVIEKGCGKMMLMHRYLMGFPRCKVDHRDRNGLHNWMGNLRLATDNDNARNRPMSSRNKSGYIGVYWSRWLKTWVACITVENKNQNLGYFQTSHAAAVARDKAAVRLHGEFASLNFSREYLAQREEWFQLDLMADMYY